MILTIILWLWLSIPAALFIGKCLHLGGGEGE